MNNKEKFLSKIGKLIEKGGISEDELATFFAPDEDEAPMEGKAEKAQPMDENAQAEVAEGAKGKEAEPTENAPTPTATEAPVAEGKTPEAGGAPTPVTPEATLEAGTPENAVSMEAVMTKIESLSKALDGMAKENEALRTALRDANVLRDKTDEGQDIGLSGSSAPSVGTNEGIARTLDKLNRGRR